MNRDEVLIEAEDLLKKYTNDNIRIFDASLTDNPYRQGHIPGAAFFDHEKFSDPTSPYISTILAEDLLAVQIGSIGISNDSEVVIYGCGMLPYAARAWWVLRYAGHKNVRVLNGGLDAWKKAGGLLEQNAELYEPSIFKGQPDPTMFANKEEVLASIDNEDVATIDVLPLISYEGAHIPGSTCLPCLDLMQGFDYFHSQDQLANRLNEVSQHKRIITYCGGGIAAAINAMAHVMVGHNNVAIYDGSMYEWLGEGLPVVGSGEWEIWQLK